MFSIWTEWTHIARRLVDKAMSNHFVLALKALATLGPRAALDRAIVRPCLRVHIRMGVQEVLGLERRRLASVKMADILAVFGRIGKRHALDAHSFCHRSGRCWCRDGVIAWRAPAIVIHTGSMRHSIRRIWIERAGRHDRLVRRAGEQIVRRYRGRSVAHRGYARHTMS